MYKFRSDERKKEQHRRELIIKSIKARLQHFHTVYGQSVDKALEKVDVLVCLRLHVIMFKLSYGCINYCASNKIQGISTPTQCEEFHNTIKSTLPKEISKMKPEGGFNAKNISEYCDKMRALLQEKLEREEKQHLKEDWSSVATEVVDLLKGMNTMHSSLWLWSMAR